MIIFNCTTNVIGGAVQNAVNFIKEIHKGCAESEYYFFLSHAVYNQVKDIVNKDRMSVFESPAKNLYSRYLIRRKAKEINAVLIYTSAGPAYVNFNSYHIMGCSNPYILGANEYALNIQVGIVGRFFRKIHSYYQRNKILKADHYICQTNASKESMIKLGVESKDISVIYNSISESFLCFYESGNYEQAKAKSTIKVFIPTAYYKHKDIDRVISLAGNINQASKVRIEFYLTIKPDIFDLIIEKYGIDDYVYNIGEFAHSEALELYLSHDIILQPSVLEVFSTSYIEAMASMKPLLVPDLDFSRDVCGASAFYYDVSSNESLIENIIFLAENRHVVELNHYEIESKLSLYGSQEERMSKILAIIEKGVRNV